MLLKIDSSSELSICRGVVDWRLGLFLFGRTGENIGMRATKPFSLSEAVRFSEFLNKVGLGKRVGARSRGLWCDKRLAVLRCLIAYRNSVQR